MLQYRELYQRDGLVPYNSAIHVTFFLCPKFFLCCKNGAYLRFSFCDLVARIHFIKILIP